MTAVPGPTTERGTGLSTHDDWRDAVTALEGPAGSRWTLLLVGVDRFIEVSAQYGHPGAGAVLGRIAVTLREVVVSGAVVGPFGTDGLVALLPWTGRSAALDAADRLCRSVRRMSVAAPDGRRVVDGLTVSVGVAVHPGTAPDPALLLWAADAALYAAKCAGGDTCRAADPRHYG